MGEAERISVRPDDHERARRLERQLEVAQQITHIGSWEWLVATGTVTWSDELYRIYGFEPGSVAITFEFFLGKLHPDDRARVQSLVGQALSKGERFAYPERIFRPDGSMRHLDTVGWPARSEGGEVIGLIGTCRDITEEVRARVFQRGEQRVLEMIASGHPLAETLETLIRTVEAHAPPMIGSILLLEGGKHVRHGAAPNLPPAFARAIDGLPIGPQAGSCGTALFRRAPVFVEDIETDPLWEPYRALAREHGLRACWSTPVLGEGARPLGTFAAYFREPRLPTKEDEQLLARAIHLAGIAIERRQLEDQLRALTARVESVREEERTGIAREIHDELGQSLTALKMDLAWLMRRCAQGTLAPDVANERLGQMSEMTDGIIQVVRRISAELRPGVLDDLGLVAAVEWQLQEFEKRTESTCILEEHLGELELDRAVSTAVFRIFQEALTNIARHAEARRVDVGLRSDGVSLVLEVCDDGRGITEAEAKGPSSLGLLGIRERARRLGGDVVIERREPRGTRLRLQLPIERSSPLPSASPRDLE